MSGQALSDLKIVEYASRISGPYCSKVMADLGAEVIKIEKPGTGDETRQMGPFVKDVPNPETSGLFLYLNGNKRSVTLNLETETGANLFREMIKKSDIFIENNSPGTMDKLRLGYKDLQKVNPGLIMTSISSFGQTGSYRDYKATELISFQMSGLGYGTPGQVENPANEPPLKIGGHQTQFLAGMTAAVGTMHALFERKITGSGQQVDISEWEAMSSLCFLTLAQYAYVHKIPGRLKTSFPGLSVIGLLRCKDGYFCLLANEDRMWQDWVEVMGKPEWANDERFKERESRVKNWDTITKLIEEWAMQYTKEEIYRAAQARRVPVFPSNTAEDLINSVHLSAREFFVGIDHPVAGKVRYPGAPYKLTATPWSLRYPAPLLGEHNEEILCGNFGCSKEDLVSMREAGII